MKLTVRQLMIVWMLAMAKTPSVNEAFNEAAQTARDLPLHANTLLGKKVRVRKCGARLRVPATTQGREAVFVCQLEKHDADVPHQEVGFVQMPNDTSRKFTMTWVDEGVASLRRHIPNKPRTSAPKVRAVK
jgi:hypothetical protein